MRLIEGDSLDVLPTLQGASVDACVTDPPYGLGFMGKSWDSTGVAFRPEAWAAVLRVLKPGAFLLAFGGTRTYHRLACAVEDAGFEIRDCLMWLYGQGMPKGRACLKPAYEPILLAMKPAKRVPALNVDGCRIPADPWSRQDGERAAGFKTGKFCGSMGRGEPTQQNGERNGSALGRWPANVLHDGSDEVLEAFAAFGQRPPAGIYNKSPTGIGYMGGASGGIGAMYGDSGTAARFYYCAKAMRRERGTGNTHATVKPLALVRWLVRLVTPKGGLVLDAFAGSGTTALAAEAEGCESLLIEENPEYCDVIRRRMADCRGELFAGVS